MSITVKNLEKLIFINKNWPNDLIIGWESYSSLVGLGFGDLY
jgi:hypothetical protein